jgi:hypothetical protein
MAMIIWGFRGRVRPLAMVRTRCPRCGQEAAHRLVRSQRWFTLFFIPIFPFRTRYIATCTYCGAGQVVNPEVAKAFAAGPGGQPGPATTPGASPAGVVAPPASVPGYAPATAPQAPTDPTVVDVPAAGGPAV